MATTTSVGGVAGAGGGGGASSSSAGGGSGGSGAPGDINITIDLDEILRRITDIKNIAGVVVVNSDGVTVKSTLDNSLTALVRIIQRMNTRKFALNPLH
jgi:hypothetical protein